MATDPVDPIMSPVHEAERDALREAQAETGRVLEMLRDAVKRHVVDGKLSQLELLQISLTPVVVRVNTAALSAPEGGKGT